MFIRIDNRNTDPPHEKNLENINWREEAQKFVDQNIQVFSIQYLNRGRDKEFEFYSSIAIITKGYHLFLNQFSYIRDIISFFMSEVIKKRR